METLRLACTSSPMARAQAARAAGRIASRLRSLLVAEVLVETPVNPAKQIERIAEKIRDGAADAGICSAASLDSTLPHGVIVAALHRDRDPRYRLVSPERPSLQALPGHARVVTCDPVSRGQIRHRHPRLQVDLAAPSWEVFAGLRHRAWDAACLPPEIFDVGSLAGLSSELLAVEEVLPAVGQGMVALLARADDARTRERLAEAGDPGLEAALGAERAFLSAASGGLLDAAAAARAVPSGWWMELTGLLVHLDGRWLASGSARPALESAATEALRLAESCREKAAKQGASDAVPREFAMR
jgi:hydroxymethylbilane synthase